MTTDSKPAILICWGKRSKNLRRDEADMVVNISVPQQHALRVAKSIDADADAQGYSKENLAAGHGVTIIYASGRRRYIREN